MVLCTILGLIFIHHQISYADGSLLYSTVHTYILLVYLVFTIVRMRKFLVKFKDSCPCNTFLFCLGPSHFTQYCKCLLLDETYYFN